MHTPGDSSVSVSPCGPTLVVSVGFLVVSLTPLSVLFFKMLSSGKKNVNGTSNYLILVDMDFSVWFLEVLLAGSATPYLLPSVCTHRHTLAADLYFLALLLILP